MTINRRRLLGLFGGAAALPAVAACTTTTTTQGDAAAGGATFAHGVASGDPLSDRAVIWTRVTTSAESVPVAWAVTDAAEGGREVRSGEAQARAARDHTVKVDVSGLQPGRDYWYSFEAGGTRSPVGRFRTLPVGATADVVLAVASCSLHPGGLFNAYDAIGRLERVDAVVHLGDYIYEYGAEGYGAETGRKLGRVADPAHEIVSLDDYRRRHAQYKADADLQAAHARAAFICVWDDHETTNDSWTDGAQNHQPETEGDWRARKARALQAYFEWMPIRDPDAGRGADAINRSFAFGDLATLLMVETRLLGRSEQLAFKGEVAPAEALKTLKADLARPERSLLGKAQRDWLARELDTSVKAGRRWQVIGNQIVMARLVGPDLERQLGAERWTALVAKLPPANRARLEGAMRMYRAVVPMNLDAWDGYPAERERVYAAFTRAGARPIVLAGDSHAFWANDLKDAGGRQVAAEFGTSAITSPSLGDALPGVDVGAAVSQASPEVIFNDQSAKGFVLLTLTPERAEAQFVAVSTVLAKPYDTRIVRRFEVTPAAGGGVAPIRML